jgi:hypothetical protein
MVNRTIWLARAVQPAVTMPRAEAHFMNFIILAGFLLVVIVATFALNRWHRRYSHNGDWHAYGIARAKRWVPMKWEYRTMTKAEHQEDLEDRQW